MGTNFASNRRLWLWTGSQGNKDTLDAFLLNLVRGGLPTRFWEMPIKIYLILCHIIEKQ